MGSPATPSGCEHTTRGPLRFGVAGGGLGGLWLGRCLELMCAQEVTEPRSALSPDRGLLTWLGGGQWRELGERHERSTHAAETGAGAVVLFGAVLAWLVAGLAVSESARWSLLAVVPLTLVFGLLVGAVTRATAARPDRGWPGVAGRAAVAAALGVVVGELAAMVLLSGSIDHRLDERALRNAGSAPAVAQASASLQQTKDARTALDSAVEQARQQQDQALVIARCEYHPTPACPQTRITGVPGAGPETRTANELLADAQHELDNALAARDRQAPELDAEISREERALDRGTPQRGRGRRSWPRRALGRDERPDLRQRRHADVAAADDRVLRAALPAAADPAVGGAARQPTIATRRRARSANAPNSRRTPRSRSSGPRSAARPKSCGPSTNSPRPGLPSRPRPKSTASSNAGESWTLSSPRSGRRRNVPSSRPMMTCTCRSPRKPRRPAARSSASLPRRRRPQAWRTCRRTSANATVAPHEGRGTSLIPSIPDATKAAARWVRPLVPPFVARVIDTTTRAAAHRASGVRGGRGDHVRAAAHPQESRSTPKAPMPASDPRGLRRLPNPAPLPQDSSTRLVRTPRRGPTGG